MSDFVINRKTNVVLSIILNRPEVINSLTIEMVNSMKRMLCAALKDADTKIILIYGRGDKGFCAGADIKSLASFVKNGRFNNAMDFFKNEYEMDLLLQRFPKPVIVIADGITMGGGLGIAEGADTVIVTERSRMAMPETRIGFFPDVGATGWLSFNCPDGYPDLLGLTGYELEGSECVRVGLATNLVSSENLSEIISVIENTDIRKSSKPEIMDTVLSAIEPYLIKDIPANPEMDDWVRANFNDKTDVKDIIKNLSSCNEQLELCRGVIERISERSPTALALTILMLRFNQGLPLEEVFLNDIKASDFMIKHPDYYEGIRARLIEKDDKPRWKPEKIEDVDLAEFMSQLKSVKRSSFNVLADFKNIDQPDFSS